MGSNLSSLFHLDKVVPWSVGNVAITLLFLGFFKFKVNFLS